MARDVNSRGPPRGATLMRLPHLTGPRGRAWSRRTPTHTPIFFRRRPQETWRPPVPSCPMDKGRINPIIPPHRRLSRAYSDGNLRLVPNGDTSNWVCEWNWGDEISALDCNQRVGLRMGARG